eukprot:385288-Pleurochrysis_carterae.AAC.2
MSVNLAIDWLLCVAQYCSSQGSQGHFECELNERPVVNPIVTGYAAWKKEEQPNLAGPCRAGRMGLAELHTSRKASASQALHKRRAASTLRAASSERRRPRSIASSEDRRGGGKNQMSERKQHSAESEICTRRYRNSARVYRY